MPHGESFVLPATGTPPCGKAPPTSYGYRDPRSAVAVTRERMLAAMVSDHGGPTLVTYYTLGVSGGCYMQGVRIARPRRIRDQERETKRFEVLPLDPRDPAILRAKELQRTVADAASMLGLSPREVEDLERAALRRLRQIGSLAEFREAA